LVLQAKEKPAIRYERTPPRHPPPSQPIRAKLGPLGETMRAALLSNWPKVEEEEEEDSTFEVKHEGDDDQWPADDMHQSPCTPPWRTKHNLSVGSHCLSFALS